VVFAGNAVIKCPLTSNYSYFRRVLRTIDYRSASQGGTRIGDGIRKTLSELLGARLQTQDDKGPAAGETVLAEERQAKAQSFADILLVTDGEDMDSFPLKAAQAAAAADVGIYAVGLGKPEGSPIPIRNAQGKVELLKARDGQVVQSKLDEKTLLDMVNASPRGSYLPVRTSDFDLADFFDKTIALEAGREIEDEEIAYTEIFQPFLLAGIAFYLAYLAWRERPRHGQLERLGSAA
jgi:Ca-activated chloride channel family protein